MVKWSPVGGRVALPGARLRLGLWSCGRSAGGRSSRRAVLIDGSSYCADVDTEVSGDSRFAAQLGNTVCKRFRSSAGAGRYLIQQVALQLVLGFNAVAPWGFWHSLNAIGH